MVNRCLPVLIHSVDVNHSGVRVLTSSLFCSN